MNIERTLNQLMRQNTAKSLVLVQIFALIERCEDIGFLINQHVCCFPINMSSVFKLFHLFWFRLIFILLNGILQCSCKFK